MRTYNVFPFTKVFPAITPLIAFVVIAASCGGDNDDGVRPTPATTDGAADVAQHDGGAATQAGQDATPVDAPDRLLMTIEAPSHRGTYSLSGTVVLPAAAKSGVRAVLAIGSGSFGEPPTFKTLEFANEFKTTSLKGGSASIPFVVKNIGPGNYFLSVVVDQNGDLFVPGPGDFGGFFAGTTTKPIGHNEEPTLITVNDRDLASLDFFIAPIRCLASYGESCVSDDDCRGTKCTGDTTIENVREGTCFQNRCREAPSCPEATDNKAQGSCFLD